MCGIAGIFHLDHRPVCLADIRALADCLRHRGPDDEGYALFDTRGGQQIHLKGADSPAGVTLQDVRAVSDQSDWVYDLAIAERRLAILDLTPAGHTPMTTLEGDLTLTFNGEIYNYVELRDELAAKGYAFNTRGDTEVLLAAYREWGTACVTHFNGMWAFALYDAPRRLLFCSRDRFGVKPFYYIQCGKLFAFASEPKALWSTGLIPPKVHAPLLEDFLAGYEASALDATLFDGIRQLPGGHNLVVTSDDVRIEPYWSLTYNPELGPEKTDAGPVARVRELLTDAVRLRLRSDVPVGTCLSGGLDSSAIVVLMNDLMRDEHNIPRHLVGDHQKTFTASYDDPASDERQYAQRIVEQTGAEWHQAFPTAETFRADLDEFIWHHDEPPITTSMYAQWCVMRLARETGVTVTLDGQGADELLGGYMPFDVALSQIWRAGDVPRFIRQAGAVARVGSLPLSRVLTRVAANQLPSAIQRRIQAARRERMLGLTRETARAAISRHAKTFDPTTYTNLPRHLYVLTLNNLPRLLRSEDRNAMAFSIEARTPFLDVRLAEYISQLPAVYRMNNGWSKLVLRNAMERTLPPEIAWRRDKKGFVTPERAWLRALRPQFADLFRESPRLAPHVDLQTVRSTLAGDRFTASAAASASVWRWVAAELWLRMIERR